MWNWIDIEEMTVRDPAISGEGTRSRAAEYYVTVHFSFYPMFIMLKRSSNLRMYRSKTDGFLSCQLKIISVSVIIEMKVGVL